MLGLARALPAAGVAARLWRPWEDSLAEADCLHVFGSLPEHLPVVEAARRQHLPVALSTMAWHGWADGPGQRPSLTRGLAACARLLGRTVCPPWRSWRRRLYQSVDLLLPHSHAEAQQLRTYFRVPAPRMHIVPGAADPQLAAADPEPFAQLVGVRNFVLYWGPIEPRTQSTRFPLGDAQHRRAGGGAGRRGAGLPVVFGRVPPGGRSARAVRRRTSAATIPCWPAPMRPAAAWWWASWREPSLLCGLGGGHVGHPPGAARGQLAPASISAAQAFYVNPRDLPGIRRAVLAALARGRSPSLARHVQTYFSWNAVAKATRAAYDSLLGRKYRDGRHDCPEPGTERARRSARAAAGPPLGGVAAAFPPAAVDRRVRRMAAWKIWLADGVGGGGPRRPAAPLVGNLVAMSRSRSHALVRDLAAACLAAVGRETARRGTHLFRRRKIRRRLLARN